MIGRKKNWYFDGWESRKTLTSSGKLKTVWEYNDDYYGFDLDERKLKLLKISFIVLPALIIALWIFFSLFKCIGRDSVLYVGAFWYVCVIPMIYLVMGACGAFKLSTEMTYRDLYACYRRIKVSSIALTILYFAAIVGDFVFVSIYNDYFSIASEMPWFLGAVLEFIISGCLFLIQFKVKKKIKIVRKSEIQEE